MKETTIKQLIRLELCIEERLKNVSSENKELLCIVENEYVHRLEKLKNNNPEIKKYYLSHLMQRAYIETKKYFEAGGKMIKYKFIKGVYDA